MSSTSFVITRRGIICTLTVLVSTTASLLAQSPAGLQHWRRLDRVPEGRPAADLWVKPERFNAVALDHAALKRELANVPMETVPGFIGSGVELALPMPDGTAQRFRVAESPVMAAALAAKFPDFKTYVGQGIDDPTASVRFDFTPAGFHAQILSPSGAVYIDPHFRDQSVYAVYRKGDYRKVADDFRCLTASGQVSSFDQVAAGDLARSGGNLRTYRLACAATAEYTSFHGGTVPAGLAGVVTAVNRINGVYETELAIRLVLVADNDLIIYTSAGTDPYSNTSGSTMLTQNQSNLDIVIGNGNYDIGHVFSTGGGGIATRGCVCVSSTKARGVTGNPSPTGDSFWIDYVVHEMGHQFGANHTFNSSAGNCGGVNRNPSTAYEPGSGSTIMAYAGICGSDDLQPHSDPYFHSISFDEILTYTTSGSGSGCPVVTVTGNSAPSVNAGANYTIPASTPFILTATGSDPNGDSLTYCWEERDLGPSTTLTAADNGSSPLFRVFNPTTNTWRTFPKPSDILNNGTSLGEKLPTTSRTMSFRVTARDNRAGGGGVNTDDMAVTVVPAAGPFVVTSQLSGGTFSNAITVTWNVANTTASPINAANVSIFLSTNGGQTFPITLLASTPNDGSQAVQLPNLNSSQARLKVQGAGNIFFDVNGANFTIVPSVPQPLVTIESVALVAEGCGPGNGAIDPGETVTVSVGLRNVGSANTTNLVATLLAGGGVTFPSGAQAYGALVAGGATVFHSYTLTATGVCAGTMSATLQLQDGPTSLGLVGQSRTLGGFTNATFGFTNSTTIGIPAAGNKGKGSPYPSSISVNGVNGTVSKITVTLVGLAHTFPDDLDLLLVGPGGQTVMLVSDAGGATPFSGLTMTVDDAAGETQFDDEPLTGGVYLPTDYDTATDAFPSPAPAGPFGTSLAVFNGSSPNGTWSLYTQDDQNQDSGELAQGWRLSITTAQGSCCGAVANNPPSLAPIAAKSVNELQNLSFTNLASDPDGNQLSFSLIGAPVGASIGTSSGVFNWTPTETQGPATNLMQVVVTDNGSPVMSATQSLTVVVSEVNQAPVLSPVSDYMVTEGSVIQFTNDVIDADLPANQLSFSLVSAPTNIVLNPATGVFTWLTGEFDGPGTNLFAVIATDNGTPSLSATQFFTTVVLESNQPPGLAPIASLIVHAGALVSFTNAATDFDWPANLLGYTLDPGAPAGAGVDTNGLFTWDTTDANADSTNQITLRVTDNGAPNLDASQSFLVTVAARPLITSIIASNDLVTLTWSTIAGESYQLQSAENLAGTNWVDVAGNILAFGSSASQTNALDAAERFFRVRWVHP